MVLEPANPLECVRAFSPWKNLQTSWRYLEKADSGSHTSFTPLEQLYLHWKTSKRASETISKEESKGNSRLRSEQQYDVQQDLFETDDNIQLDDSPVDFEKTTKGFTDKTSQTDDLNNTLEVELKRLKHSVKELKVTSTTKR